MKLKHKLGLWLIRDMEKPHIRIGGFTALLNDDEDTIMEFNDTDKRLFSVIVHDIDVTTKERHLENIANHIRDYKF